MILEAGYSEEMRALVERNRRLYGVETILFSGTAHMRTSDGLKSLRGFRLPDGAIGVQYDNAKYTPEQITKHEMGHNLANTRAFRIAKALTRRGLSPAERRRVSHELYATYEELAKGDEAYIWEEFTCDALAGMGEYGERFKTAASDFWRAQETGGEKGRRRGETVG